jgi:hypothetical protein
MVKLVRDFRWAGTPSMFGNYLIIAICWEETTFMNIPQVKGPARGFGQLEPSALKLIIKKFDLDMTLEECQKLLDTSAHSIQFVGRALHTIHDNILHNAKEKKTYVRDPFMTTLNGYAGNFGAYKAAWRDEAIRCWLNCANHQSMARHIAAHGEYLPNRQAVSEALWKGMPPNRRPPEQGWEALMGKVLEGIP